MDAEALEKWAQEEAGEEQHAAPDDDKLLAAVGLAYLKRLAEEFDSEDLDDETRKWMEEYDPDEDGNPPSWVKDEAAWSRAKSIAEEKWEDYDEPWGVVAHIYQNMLAHK